MKKYTIMQDRRALEKIEEEVYGCIPHRNTSGITHKMIVGVPYGAIIIDPSKKVVIVVSHRSIGVYIVIALILTEISPLEKQ